MTKPDLDLQESYAICWGDEIEIDVSFPNADYLWQDNFTSPVYLIGKPGIYNVKIKNICGYIEKSIKVDLKDLNLFVPNVITPNNDNINDQFEIIGTDAGIELIILNRWGKKVYESDNYNNTWTGGMLPSGTYYYLAHDHCNYETYKGAIKLLR